MLSKVKRMKTKGLKKNSKESLRQSDEGMTKEQITKKRQKRNTVLVRKVTDEKFWLKDKWDEFVNKFKEVDLFG